MGERSLSSSIVFSTLTEAASDPDRSNRPMQQCEKKKAPTWGACSILLARKCIRFSLGCGSSLVEIAGEILNVHAFCSLLTPLNA